MLDHWKEHSGGELKGNLGYVEKKKSVIWEKAEILSKLLNLFNTIKEALSGFSHISWIPNRNLHLFDQWKWGY